MPLANYGVLKGTLVGHLRDADDDHYQLLLQAGKQLHRAAVNVKSSAPNAPATLLFHSSTAVPERLTTLLDLLKPGFTKVRSRANSLALDYLRGGLFRTTAMKPVPPDAPGADTDLKDLLEAAVLRAMKAAGSQCYVFGVRWGPEPRPDQYFRFAPGNGVHEVHMNQGNSGRYRKDNGTWQDGALLLQYPAAQAGAGAATGSRWRAFYFSFHSQRFTTDPQGNPQVSPNPR